MWHITRNSAQHNSGFSGATICVLLARERKFICRADIDLENIRHKRSPLSARSPLSLTTSPSPYPLSTRTTLFALFAALGPNVNVNVNWDIGHLNFHFHDFEVTTSRSSEVKCFCGFLKSDINFPIVVHGNHMLISLHKEDIGDFHICDLEMTHKGQSRSKVKTHFY